MEFYSFATGTVEIICEFFFISENAPLSRDQIIQIHTQA
jgi:hypothetical protein